MNKKLYDLISDYIPNDEKEKLDREVMLDFIKKNKDVLTRNNRIAHFTTSAWIVNLEHTKILMIYHNIYNSWAWVGGHADGDDDLLRVIYKEIEEETGLTNLKLLMDDVFGINIITVDNHIRKGEYVNSHLHFDVEYLFEANEKDFIRIKEDENQGVQWVPIDKVEDYSSEEKMKPIYKKLNKKLERIPRDL